MGLLFIAASIIGLVGRFIQLPLIVSYILAGIIIGPTGFKLINDPAQIQALSTLGIVFLLFLVGIELNFKKLKEVGSVSLLTTLVQISLTLVGSLLIARFLGFSLISGIYIAIALCFNSTVIVVKALSERRELDSLHGRITVGVLLIQDAIAILALIFLNNFANGHAVLLSDFILIGVKAVVIALGAILAGTYIFPILFKQLAKSSELLMISAIGWALFAALGVHYLGFSIESGAFIAGVSLAALPYTTEITSKIRTLRDFFVTIFFVALGMTVSFAHTTFVLPIILFTLALVIGTPLIVMVALLLQGYKARTSLLSGISFSQIGEFSLIVLTVGHGLGHISTPLLSALTLITIISIIISSFLMNHAHTLTRFFIPYLKLLETKRSAQAITLPEAIENHVVIFGAHQIGQTILNKLKKYPDIFSKIVVVDVNPTIIKELKEQNITAIYGDVIDPQIIEAAQIDKAQLVISTIPEFEANLNVIQIIKKNHRRTTVIYLTAKNPQEALQLYEAGADYVILPQYLSGEYVSSLIENFNQKSSGLSNRDRHIKELKKYTE